MQLIDLGATLLRPRELGALPGLTCSMYTGCFEVLINAIKSIVHLTDIVEKLQLLRSEILS